MKTPEVIVQRAGLAAKLMAVAGPGRKNAALRAMAAQLTERSDELETALRVDAADAAGVAGSPFEWKGSASRLTAQVEKEWNRLAAEPEPVGCVINGQRLEDGTLVETVCTPLGVVGVIAGGDPLFLLRAAALAVKSGNAAVVAGDPVLGRTQVLLLDCLRQGLLTAGLPADALQLLESRGGELLTAVPALRKLLVNGRSAKKEWVHTVAGRVPVLVIDTPVDHLFAAQDADPETVVNLTVNACAAMSRGLSLHTLLLHRSLAGLVLEPLAQQLAEAHMALCGDEDVCRLAQAEPVTDWRASANGRLCVRLVDSMNEALALISVFGSGHAAGILTNDHAAAQRFFAAVDAAVVSVNAAPAFADGERLGEPVCLGLAAGAHRGPVGLSALMAYKRIVTGNGQIR